MGACTRQGGQCLAGRKTLRASTKLNVSWVLTTGHTTHQAPYLSQAVGCCFPTLLSIEE